MYLNADEFEDKVDSLLYITPDIFIPKLIDQYYVILSFLMSKPFIFTDEQELKVHMFFKELYDNRTKAIEY